MAEKDLEWFHQWFNQDYLKLYSNRNPREASDHVDFLIKALDLEGTESILDLGCGMGRHTIEFANRGFDATGVDLSSFLIDKGKKRLEGSSRLKATLLAGDMFSIKNLPHFDVVINMFTSFGYFVKDEENAQVFEVVRKHLKPEGKFFLDYFHPEQVIRDLKESEIKMIEGEKVEISKRIEGDRVIKTILFTDPKRIYQEKVKLYSRAQIEMMLREHSLKVIDVWNDYQGNPWREDGDRQLFYCRRDLE